jgi:alpha-glucosidase (family GH31 glycosyl hydrolase)
MKTLIDNIRSLSTATVLTLTATVLALIFITSLMSSDVAEGKPKDKDNPPFVAKQIYEHDVGNFNIQLEVHPDNRLKKIAAYHTSNPNKEILSSVNGKFIKAVQADAILFDLQRIMNFRKVETILLTLSDQRVETVKLLQKKMIVIGTLVFGGDDVDNRGDGQGEEEVGYKLTFYNTDDMSENRLGFEIKLDPSQKEFNHIYLKFSSDPDESFFGFGLQPGYFELNTPEYQKATLDFKGQVRTALVKWPGGLVGRYPEALIMYEIMTVFPWATPYNGLYELVTGDSDDTTYASPYFLTNNNRGMFLENYEYSEFDFTQSITTPNSYVEIRLWNSKMDGNLLYGETPKDIVREYTDFTGRMKPFPGWLNEGAMILLSEWTPNGGIEAVVNLLTQEDTPIGVVGVWNWEGPYYDSKRFGYPEEEYEALKSFLDAKGIEVGIWFNALAVPLSGHGHTGDPDHDPCPAEEEECVYGEAHRKGYLIKIPDPDGPKPEQLYVFGWNWHMIDLTNEDAYNWFKGIMREALIKTGALMWCADFGEEYPFDAIIEGVQDPRAYSKHNKFPEIWAQLNRDVADELKDGFDDEYGSYEGDGKERVFWMRNGFLKSPGIVPLFWTADQNASWDLHQGIKTVPMILLSGGLSGATLNHPYIGGYFSTMVQLTEAIVAHLESPEVDLPVPENEQLVLVRTQELHDRWAELCAFTPVYSNNEGMFPGANYQIYEHHGPGHCYGLDPCPFPSTFEARAEPFSKFAKVYASLAFYREELMEEAEEHGYPLVRHMMLEYPDDPNSYGIDLQWMLGSEILVAPVLDEGATVVNAYLPAGNWVHLWTGQTYSSNGGWYEVDAPIGEPGVFYKSGSQVGAQFVQNLIDRGINVPQVPQEP